jgi:hypothetical protein
LRHFVHRIDVIQAFDAVPVALMHGVDGQISGSALGRGLRRTPIGIGEGRVGW